MSDLAMKGTFVDDDGDQWYRIEGYDHQAPFFMTLAGDSDLWAFISSAGSLTAGRRDQDGAFFPYETVDKIHLRGAHTGPRTWIRILGSSPVLWQPFAATYEATGDRRSVWKNLSGTRVKFREVDPSGHLAFSYEWSTTADWGLVRLCRLEALKGPVPVQVLDGLLNLIPPGITFEHSSTMSSLTDAYKWNEAMAEGRLGVYTLYAQIWDRAEPKDSFSALTVWSAGVPAGSVTLLSDWQVDAFCRTGLVEPETLTRGRRGAFLTRFDSPLSSPLRWALAVDGPRGQVQVAEWAALLSQGHGQVKDLEASIVANQKGLDELVALADGFQSGADPMASAHHRANVLFNIMRGGVFLHGNRLDRDDLVAFVKTRNKRIGEALAAVAVQWPPVVERGFALDTARATWGPSAERLILEYLPLTFSRRHGDPSRPWNRFSIRVRDGKGQRVLNYQGNWRDIFQNWEALVASEPAFLGSMIATFVGSMTPDGYNPYRVSRDGVDWEVVEHDNPWSNIGYWGDHQVVYLLKFLEAARDRDPALLDSLWNRSLFGFADVPYRLKPHQDQTSNPKATITFDEQAHLRAQQRKVALGSDGLLVADANGDPILATLGEKLAILLLAKAGSLIPGGGLWLHTQRPEWNDANNALVGNGLSVVTLGYLRRFLTFLTTVPTVAQPFAIAQSTLTAIEAFMGLLESTPAEVVTDSRLRRRFVDACGHFLDPWREAAYQGGAARKVVQAPEGLLVRWAQSLLPLIDATLAANRRPDHLYHSYNLVDFRNPDEAVVSNLYPMLEGQVSILSSGFLNLSEAVEVLRALYASPLYTPGRKTFLLYPDRDLPRFLERNRLDAAALSLPLVQELLDSGRSDLLQRQSDGTVRFAPALANRADLLAAGRDLGERLIPLADEYDRLLRHHEFTGRSGTMFGYEGLGCVYWHMVAKLLLAVQELVFNAAETHSPQREELAQFYRRVRDGLGYRKTAAEYGAFPADPYSHTPGEGGAQQPGMTGQVKEEILTRWGELGLRVKDGQTEFLPILLDDHEIPAHEALTFTWNRVPWEIRRGPRTTLRVLQHGQWTECQGNRFSPDGVERVEATVYFQRG